MNIYFVQKNTMILTEKKSTRNLKKYHFENSLKHKKKWFGGKKNWVGWVSGNKQSILRSLIFIQSGKSTSLIFGHKFLIKKMRAQGMYLEQDKGIIQIKRQVIIFFFIKTSYVNKIMFFTYLVFFFSNISIYRK